MNVKIKLGGKLYDSELKLNDANHRIAELMHIVGEKEEELVAVKKESQAIQIENNCYKIKIDELNDKIKLLEEELKVSHLEKENESNEMKKVLANNYEGVSINKNLKKELENYENLFSLEVKKSNSYLREIEELEKITNKFENGVIELTQINSKLSEKVKVYENVLKQKENYINIILKKKLPSGVGSTSSSSNILLSKPNIATLDTIETQQGASVENKNIAKKYCRVNSGVSNSNRSNNSNNISNRQSYNQLVDTTVLQNKITELEKVIKLKDEQLKKLEIDKNNLMIRIRNITN